MSLDPPISDAEIIRKAVERGVKVDAPPSDEELLRRATQGLKKKAVDCGQPEPERPPRVERRAAPRQRGAVTLGRLERHLENGQLCGLAGTIYGAPRTKKNHNPAAWKVNEGYKHWCQGVQAALMPQRVTLPDSPLNLEAHFYVDNKGVPADLVGLLQGFCDALQAAGVVTNDIWILGFDGSRKHTDEQRHPRCLFELCPLPNRAKK